MTTTESRFTEQDVEDYICSSFEDDGTPYQRQVQCPGLERRADIVIPGTVVEVKRRLTYDSIYHAYGQGQTYRQSLGLTNILIIGCYPVSETSRLKAERLAQDIQLDPTVEVFFINTADVLDYIRPVPNEPSPVPYYYEPSDDIPIPVLAGGVTVIILLVFLVIGMFQNSPMKQLELGRKAGWKSQYVEAAQHFKKAKELSDKPCVKKYASRMQTMVSKAAKYKAQGTSLSDINKQFTASLKDADRQAASSKCKVR
ncbi:MAG TPA: hypothetical protein V6D48_02055 [Oculatellaceae cyanobacterium]